MNSPLKKKQKISRPALFSFIAAVLIRGVAGSGINMSSSLFLRPVSEELSVGVGTLSIFFSIASLVMILWLPAAGRILRKYSLRKTVLIAGALQALSFASLGFSRHLWLWYVITVPQTLGAVILVNLLGPIVIHRYFGKKTGVALGVQMSLVWIIAVALQPAVSFVIEKYGWRNGYFFMGLLAFLVISVSALFLLKDEGARDGDLQEQKSKEKIKILNKPFLLLLIFTVALTGAAVFTQHIPSYATLIGYPQGALGAFMAFTSLGSALGSLLIGFVSYRLGAKKTSFGIVALWLVAIAGFIFCKHSFTFFGVFCFLHGVCSAGVAVLSPILTTAFFGEEKYERVYARVAMGAPIAAILLIPAYGFVYDAFKSYLPVLLFACLLLLLGGVALMLVFRKSSNKYFKIKSG